MEKEEKKNVHAGHRARLTEQIFVSGIDKVSEVQAVEYFLTTIIPRVDVNPLAHALLKKYGSFHNIVDADVNDLVDVNGISEVTAKRIKLFSQLMDHYVASKLDKKISLKNSGLFLDYLEELMRFKTSENFYFFAINNSFCVTALRKLDMNSVRTVGITPEYVFKFVASTKPMFVVIAHNHPGGTAHASETDFAGNERIEKIIGVLGCKLFDSFVVGADGIFSCKQENFVRRFRDQPPMQD